MLYQFYEAQRALMEPFAEFALASSKMLANPVSPLSQIPLVQRISASYDLMYRLGKDYVKPAFGIHSVHIKGSDVAVQEHIEISKPFCDLLRFKRFSDNAETLHSLHDMPAVLV
ncbi:MAG: polyhydroxyalkanoate depolymerase, partial [Betaproteobacteria bacterium]|nr:polyhydroxyalkanoate depolymerase [Betaproteobacteria bacterium]